MYATRFRAARFRSACVGSLAILAFSLAVVLASTPAAHAQLMTYGPGTGGNIPDNASGGGRCPEGGDG